MYRIPDRIRLFSAVAVTAALPRSMRIAARSRLLRRLHRSKSRNADIMVINHPKSGGTWFRVMLSRLYQMHYGLPPRRIVKSDEFYNRNRAMPRFLISNGYYTYESATQDVLDEADPGVASEKKVILLARHPCDVAVSWYLQITKRTKAYKRELINSTLRQPIDRDKISMWDFMMHEELGLMAPSSESPIKHAGATFVSFVSAGFLPLVPYIVGINDFTLSAIFAAVALFTVGALRKFFSGKPWLTSGLEMLLIGGSAAVIAYFIGFALKSLVG